MQGLWAIQGRGMLNEFIESAYYLEVRKAYYEYT